MQPLREVVYVSSVTLAQDYILAADIGGTNSNFGFFVRNDHTFRLIFSVHAKSQEVVEFEKLVQTVLEYAAQKYQARIMSACFACAGVVSETRDYCKPTNLPFSIDAKKILSATSLRCAILVNDFEVIGHGITKIDPAMIVCVYQGVVLSTASRGILGAGTGLGKCSLLWDNHSLRYMPLPSEGGHADFAAQSREDYQLVEFITKTENRCAAISWEDVLSGNGIKRIYHFFQSLDTTAESSTEIMTNGLHPDLIFKSRNLDVHAYKTYMFYQKIYARCAKNFALDALTRGGLYIAGGIASKNVELFQDPNFLKEFVNCGKQSALLEQIPLYVIKDYNVSLYGAAAYMVLEGLCS